MVEHVYTFREGLVAAMDVYVGGELASAARAPARSQSRRMRPRHAIDRANMPDAAIDRGLAAGATLARHGQSGDHPAVDLRRPRLIDPGGVGAV
jgi:hypothetical protein